MTAVDYHTGDGRPTSASQATARTGLCLLERLGVSVGGSAGRVSRRSSMKDGWFIPCIWTAGSPCDAEASARSGQSRNRRAETLFGSARHLAALGSGEGAHG